MGCLSSERMNYSEQNLVENLFHLQCFQEDLHMKFMKIALGVNSTATNFAGRSELGRFPFHISSSRVSTSSII